LGIRNFNLRANHNRSHQGKLNTMMFSGFLFQAHSLRQYYWQLYSLYPAAMAAVVLFFFLLFFPTRTKLKQNGDWILKNLLQNQI